MARTARASQGGICYHVINRGNARARVFHDDTDYREFLRLMDVASERLPMRLLAYCLLPNHFHLVIWPAEDGDLSRWMQGLMTAHVRSHHRRHGTEGHLWQGRFKAFPIQQNAFLLSVLRYVERNPVRAELVARAEDWSWSSLSPGGTAPAPKLHRGPVPRAANWLDWVNQDEESKELAALRNCVNRGAPRGGEDWVRRMAARLGLESSVRPRGRPRKTTLVPRSTKRTKK